MDINRITGAETINQINATKVVDKKQLKDNFKVRVENIAQEEIRTKLNEIYGKIEESSQKLANKLRLSDLVEYKSLIKQFLNIAVKNSHVFFKENSLDRRGRHRIYSIVKQVDSELDELTKDFLNIEEKRLDILGKIEEIRGILLDIMT